MKIQKNFFFWGGGGGRVVGSGWGGNRGEQGGCEWRSEAFVKIKKKLGGGGKGGWGVGCQGGRVGGCQGGWEKRKLKLL